MAFKICPECSTKAGVRTHTCKKCNYSFGEKEKEKVAEKQLPIELRGPIPTYVAPKKLSSADHAKRILGYGKERASLLLQSSKMLKCWSHVDWSIVEAGLL